MKICNKKKIKRLIQKVLKSEVKQQQKYSFEKEA